MRWSLETPPEREKELREWERLNKRKAKRLQNKPKLLWFEQELLSHFFTLGRRRQYGMSELPLSVEAITIYAERFGFSKDFRFFFRCMSELDDEYLIFQSKKAKEEQARKSQRSRTRP